MPKTPPLRIVDYKTGGSPKTPAQHRATVYSVGNASQLYLPDFPVCRHHVPQTNLESSPSLLYIHRAASESYSPVIEMGAPRQPKVPVYNFAFYEDDFRERLSALLQEIYNPGEPFTQTKDTKKCEYCDFKRLCNK